MSDVYQGMLETLRAEKRKLQQQLAKLEEQEKTILSWSGEETPGTNRPKLIIKPRLPTFLRETIQDGVPRDNAELAELAKSRGIVEGDIDLRSINAMMLGLMKADLVQRKHDKWVRKGN